MSFYCSNYRPFCSKCECEPNKPFHDRVNDFFSEAKEEEVDCQYCKQKNVTKQAETLFNGLPSCRECRKKSAVNIIARDSTNQKIVLTQVSSTRDGGNLLPSLRNPLVLKSLEGDCISKLIKSPRYVEFKSPRYLDFNSPKFTDENAAPTTHYNANPTVSHYDYGNTRKDENGFEPNNARKVPPLRGLVMSSLVLSPRNMNVDNNMNIVRSSVNSGLLSVASSLSDLSLAKEQFNKSMKDSIQPDKKMKDGKVSDFFAKVKKNGFKGMKGLLFSSLSSAKNSEKVFYEKCGKQCPLLMVVVMQSGFCFGGFWYNALDKAGEKADKLAGLFSTQDLSKLSFYRINDGAVKHTPNGISFGNPVNLKVSLDDITQSVCKLEMPLKSPNDDVMLFRIDQEPKWHQQIKEIAVYKL